MTSVLALDPAWTDRHPSGVALVREVHGAWECVALAPSYSQFERLASRVKVDWSEEPLGATPNVAGLLRAAESLLDGTPVDVVTIDMPVSLVNISGRRAADNLVASAYGAQKIGTHSPGSLRPGVLGQAITEAFEASGYPVATLATIPGTKHVLAEVYPHPALLTLLGASSRVPYKIGKVTGYWPELSGAERRRRIVATWHAILEKLAAAIAGIDLPLPTSEALESIANAALKRYEDALDALVCAWIGVQYLEGRSTPFGDELAAIWLPT